MKTILFITVILSSLACSGASAPAPQGPTPSPKETTEPLTWKAECQSCLDSGKNWTGDVCEKECLMDTWCYGPGNSAAPTCPAEKPEESSSAEL
jgi:hypothetical protein